MPVGGNQLAEALKEAQKLIQQSGAIYGDLLVLTGKPPSETAIDTAKKLAEFHIQSSILGLTTQAQQSAAFKAFAAAGNGKNITFSQTDEDIQAWLNQKTHESITRADLNHTIPIWRDDGRWFLLPALLFLLPVFRRTWLIRLST